MFPKSLFRRIKYALALLRRIPFNGVKPTFKALKQMQYTDIPSDMQILLAYHNIISYVCIANEENISPLEKIAKTLRGFSSFPTIYPLITASQL